MVMASMTKQRNRENKETVSIVKLQAIITCPCFGLKVNFLEGTVLTRFATGVIII